MLRSDPSPVPAVGGAGVIRGSSFCSSLLCVFFARGSKPEKPVRHSGQGCACGGYASQGMDTRGRESLLPDYCVLLGRERGNRQTSRRTQTVSSIDPAGPNPNQRAHLRTCSSSTTPIAILPVCLPASAVGSAAAAAAARCALLSVRQRPSVQATDRPTIDHRALARRSSACVYLSMYVWVVSHSNATHCMHGWGRSCIDRSIINAHMHARNTHTAAHSLALADRRRLLHTCSQSNN